MSLDKNLKVIHCYKTDRVHLPNVKGHSCSGLAYRRTPRLEDLDENCVACWDTYVWGTPQDGGYVKVGKLYLPMTLDGVPVLAPVEQPDPDAQGFSIEAGNVDTTVSCMSRREVTPQGLVYCKPLSKLDAHFTVPWDSVVFGKLEEDSIEVNGRYLPLKVNGQAVVIKQDKVPEVIKAAEDQFPAPKADRDLTVINCYKVDRVHLLGDIGYNCAGLAYRRTPNQRDLDDHCVACWDTYVWGTPHHSGFVKVGKLYLPTTLHGVPVLAPVEQPDPDAQGFSIEAGNVDTTVSCLSFLKRRGVTPRGLLYCKTRNKDNLDGHLTVPWDSVVFGNLEEDFIEVNGRYLPLKVDGAAVVVKQEKLQEVLKAADSSYATESLHSGMAAHDTTFVSDDTRPSVDDTHASTDRELEGGQASLSLKDAEERSSDIQQLALRMDAVGQDITELLGTVKSIENRVKAMESRKVSSEANGNLEFRFDKSNRDFEERLGAIAESHLEQIRALGARLGAVEDGKIGAALAPAADAGLKDLEARLAALESGKLAAGLAPAADAGLKDLEARLVEYERKMAARLEEHDRRFSNTEAIAASQVGSKDVFPEEYKKLVPRIAACEAELRNKASGAVVEAIHRTGGEVTTLKEILTKRLQACEAAMNNQAYGESINTSANKESVAMALSQEAKQELSQLKKALDDEESARVNQLSTLQNALTIERNERTKQFSEIHKFKELTAPKLQFMDAEIGKRASVAALDKVSLDVQRLEQQLTGPNWSSPPPTEPPKFEVKQSTAHVAAYDVPISPRPASYHVPRSPNGRTMSSSPADKEVQEISSNDAPAVKPPSPARHVFRSPSSPQPFSPRILIASPSQSQIHPPSPRGSTAFPKAGPPAPPVSSRGTSPVVFLQGAAISRSVSPHVLQAQPQVLQQQRVPGLYIIPGAQGS